MILTAQAGDSAFQIDAARARAVACLPRDLTREELLMAIERVLAGQLLFAREVLARALQPIELTDRERQVLKLLAQGQTNPQIAETLMLQVSTVCKYSQQVLEKLGVDERREAVRRARRRGLV